MAAQCFVCLQDNAVSRVVIRKFDGDVTRYVCCEDCEPRHIPGGDVVVIEIRPLFGEPDE